MAYEFLAGCYDAFTADVHYARWADYLEKHFARSRLPIRTVLDLACGMGRHTRFFSALDHKLTSVDKAPEATRSVADIAETITADIENNAWPLTGRSFDGVVVTNYLWRPLWPQILDSVKPGGVLIYETFMVGNAAYGKPSNPAFLFQAGELRQLAAAAGLREVEYAEGYVASPKPAMRQAVCAIRD